MNKTIGEARSYVDELLAALPVPGVQVFVLPPLTALAAVRDRVGGRPGLMIGAQNAHWAPEGAGTGEVSMRMVQDAGAQIVEMGHSERRALFGETDETVANKARAAIDHGLIPLVCVGEPAEVRSSGRADDYVVRQLRAGLARLSPAEVRRCLVAYEPVWAIGSGGRPATREEVAPVMTVLAEELDMTTGGRGSLGLLYGGGVDAGNAAGLLADPHTGGLFVGRAAWSVPRLVELIEIAALHERAGS
jgi:triosephosphate isomerase